MTSFKAKRKALKLFQETGIHHYAIPDGKGGWKVVKKEGSHG